jgi:hypothetical protein
MKERYNILKMIYPNYLIYIKKKDKYQLINIDSLIDIYFNTENTNKIYLDNLEIEKIEEHSNNNYELLEKKTKLIILIERLKSL